MQRTHWAVAALLLIPPVWGQVIVHGSVADQSGAPLEGTRVEVKAKAFILATMSDDSGHFTLNLPAGEHDIAISHQNFATLTRKVTANGDETLDLGQVVLTVERVEQRIDVAEGSPYLSPSSSSATKTLTPLIDIPQSVSIVTREQIQDQVMLGIGDVVRYVPGVTAVQGENNRDQLVIRGNSTSADFFVDGVRDDVQYYRDLYNLDRVEVLKGPNALIFGRGGAGGVVNRVTKEAAPMRFGEFTVLGGSFGNKRGAFDFNAPLSSKLSARLNAMYENSGSFRDYVSLERYGISPSLTIAPNRDTKLGLHFENFLDRRGSDRGIPSFQGKPVDLPTNVFFGNPAYNNVRAQVNAGTLLAERHIARLTLRNRSSFADYDRSYQNFVPGAATPDGLRDSLSGYNNATSRRNIFNQTDAVYQASTGSIRHTLLGGIELGRQLTDNLRNTAYFNGTSLTVLVPLTNPTISTPVTFRPSATDADNRLRTNLASVYVQDQAELNKRIQLIGGLRIDYFDLQYHNNRDQSNLRRIDRLISPRAGVVVKPADSLALYASYSVTHLPSSGDQFSSLTTVTQQVKPEHFHNYEAGLKWQARNSLSVTAAVFRLDRENTRSIDPNDATRIVQTGSSRTNGAEFGVSGNVTKRWSVAGGYSYQDAFIVAATVAAKAGAQVAQAPHHTISMWNNVRVNRRWSAGFGLVNRADMFAAVDNTVTLPSYTRADAALFYRMSERARVQVNVENLTDRKYFLNADNNNNISPGSPRAIRLALTYRF